MRRRTFGLVYGLPFRRSAVRIPQSSLCTPHSSPLAAAPCSAHTGTSRRPRPIRPGAPPDGTAAVARDRPPTAHPAQGRRLRRRRRARAAGRLPAPGGRARALGPRHDRAVRPAPRRAVGRRRRGRRHRRRRPGPARPERLRHGHRPDPRACRAVRRPPLRLLRGPAPVVSADDAGRGHGLLHRPGRPPGQAAGHLQRPLDLQPALASPSSASWPTTRGSSAARTSSRP